MQATNQNKAKTFIFRMILTAVIFFAISIPFKNLFALVPGMTEVRPANAIPPLFGIMFGLPAACGITIGNFIADMISGSSISIAVQGGITNFMFAYVPYKMWYTMRNKDGSVYRPCLFSVKDMVKYIFIILIDSFICTTLLTFIFEGAGFSSACDSGLLLYFNNFDFAMILGVPFLALAGNSEKIQMAVPKKREISEGAKKFWSLTTAIPYLISIIGIAYFCVSMKTKGALHPSFTKPTLIIMMLLLVLYAFKPMIYDVKEEKKKGVTFTEDGRKMTTIRAKVTLGFIIISACFITFAGISTYLAISKSGLERLEVWSYVYNVVGIATNFVFAVTIAFLWYVERSISNPVEKLTELVSSFAKQDHNGDNDNEELQAQCKSIRTNDEIERLAVSFETMMQDIDDYVANLATVMSEKERVSAELNIATHIQQSMLPCIFPAFPERSEIDIYASMDPAKEVGGDFYDFFMVDDRHLAVVMADVSGKGVPAALFMVIGKTLIKDHTEPGRDLGDVFSKVNDMLCEANSEGLFITAFEGVLDLVTGEFNYVNAGHEMPFIYKKNEGFKAVKIKPGFVLAGMEGMRYKAGSAQLEVGDKLFQYTDGVTEATNANNELYGMDRLDAILNKVKEMKPEEILPSVKKDIDEFVGDAPQFDDITMLCLEYREKMQEENK